VTADAVVAEFTDPWEAHLARDWLADAGIEAWLEGTGPDRRLTGEGGGRLRLVVPQDEAEEARGLLVDMAEDGEGAVHRHRRPIWMAVVAAVVLVGLVWAAVPQFLWPWILVVALAGLLLWHAVRSGPRP
jgi:Putative prokaryotic signal transducing protein